MDKLRWGVPFVLLACFLNPLMALAGAQFDCRRAATAEHVIACYLPIVMKTAAAWDVDPALVLAIIQQESRFNLYAISKSNALGLMQLVPGTGGKDVTHFLTGHAVTLPDHFVLEPIHNINLGIVFLHLLQTNYLAGIEDDDARRYAVIAAYNGGIGTLRRWYATKNALLVERVNADSAEHFRSAILVGHPFAETRDYLQRVDANYRFFRQVLRRYAAQ